MLAKDLKKIWRPKLQAEPDKYYPTKVFQKYGFTTAKCPHCGMLYWRHTDKQTTCGDSDCLKQYTFLSDHPKNVTCAEVFQSFKDHFEHTPVANTLVNRYPCVCRWRDDVEFTAAGIYCYQPYCVTGQVDPPANPLIQAQFCLRFNDLDSIGLSGRHYSGFHMLGVQVFNKENNYKYWNEEIVDYNIQWLMKLGIDLDRITFTADCWAGGGNLGPCVEYFINGLEIGNMVFTQFKSFADGHIEELPIKVIDEGIGLERIPWLLSGNVTSYLTAFPHALDKLCDLIKFDKAQLTSPAWKHFGPRSCLLNIDECADVEKTWEEISQSSGIPKEEFKQQIEIVHDLYIVLDHLRTLLVSIQDGALPSNVGGGNNLRNVYRRVLNILQKRGWLEKLGIDGIMQIMDAHRIDLEAIHGPNTFTITQTLKDILQLEMTRWQTTDTDAAQKLQKMLKKSPVLSIDDWVIAATTYGIDPDTIKKISGQDIPSDFYSKVSEQQEKNEAKVAKTELYCMQNEKETDQIYYTEKNGEQMFDVEGCKFVKALEDKEDKNKLRIILTDKTIFFPTEGGQACDFGYFETDAGEKIKINKVLKVGPVILHYCEADSFKPFTTCSMHIDRANRLQLMAHHTGAHIVNAACKRILGQHIWQAGAKKTNEIATLDVTHYQAITKEQEIAIENEANRIIQQNHPITKTNLLKNEAEKLYGFTLYQGGVVPGCSVRCVVIKDVDAEACCGTHFDNTSSVGLIRIVKTNRISDGVVRVTFVAGESALRYTNSQQMIFNQLQAEWGVDQDQIVKTGEKFFQQAKIYKNKADSLADALFNERLQVAAGKPIFKCIAYEDAPTKYVSQLAEILFTKPEFIENGTLKTQFLFVGATFVVAVGNSLVEQIQKKCDDLKVKTVKKPLQHGKGKKAISIAGNSILMCTSLTGKQHDELAAGISE